MRKISNESRLPRSSGHSQGHTIKKVRQALLNTDIPEWSAFDWLLAANTALCKPMFNNTALLTLSVRHFF